MSDRPKFAVVEDQPATAESTMATRMLMIGIATLGQRFVVALSNLFTAVMIFAAWWLWAGILPNPTTLQLVGVGMFALFILAVEVIRRKK